MLRPKIKEHLDIFPTGADSYQARGPEYLSVLKGETVRTVLGHLLPLLDGEHSTDEVLAQLHGIAAPETIRALIQKLESLGLLEDFRLEDQQVLSSHEAQLYKSQVLFFKTTTRDIAGAKYQKALLESSVSIIGTGELAKRISRECRLAGVGKIDALNIDPVAEEGGTIETPGLDVEDMAAIKARFDVATPPLLVLALDGPRPDLINQVNQLSQDMNIPLLHAAILGKEGIVGPLVAPGKTACLKCHHLRVIRNGSFYEEQIQWEKWIETDGKHKNASNPSVGPFTGIIAGMAALEILKKLSSFYEPSLYGKFLAVNAMTLEVIAHKLLRVPRCPSCGKLRDKVSFTPWTKDERASAKGRVSYKPGNNAGENGSGV